MRQFKRLILVISLAISTLIIPVQVYAGSVVEVTTFQEYIDAMENKEVSHIKLKNDINNDLSINEFYTRSSDKLKVIDFNGHKISTRHLTYYIYRHYDEGTEIIYDEFKIVFQDSSASQLGEYNNPNGSQLIDFYKMGAVDTELTVEILGGNFKSTGTFARLFFFQNGTENNLDVNFIIEKGYFVGAYQIFHYQLQTGQMEANFKNLTYEGYDSSVVRLTEYNNVPLRNYVDPDQSEMWVDGEKVINFDDLVENFTGEKIDVRSLKTELTISGLTNNQTFTYDGNPQAPSGSLEVEGGHVQVSELEVLYEGVGSTSYNDVNPPTDAGEYQVIYKIADSNPDYYGSVTYDFEIKKAYPLFILPSNLVGYVGEPLSTVITSPWFTWESPSTIMDTAGVQTFKATYTPADTDNYLIVTGFDIKVNVKNKFQVNTSVVGNGSINPGAIMVEGETFTVEVTPDANHHLEKLTINGVEVAMGTNTYDVVVDEDLDIVATFAIDQYSVIVLDHDTNGVTVTPSGVINVNHGDDLDVEIVVKHGYKLVSILVNDVEKTSELVGNILTLSNITSSQFVEVNVEKIVYLFISGEDSSFTLDKDSDVEVVLDAELSNLDKVVLDGKVVDSVNYEAKAGSLVVVFKKAYLNSLKPGVYPLEFLFKDGAISQTTLSIKAKAAEPDDEQTIPEQEEKPKDPEKSTEPEKDKLPGMGDNHFLIYLALLLLVLGSIFNFKGQSQEE
jgi:hypothetical protein